MTRHNTDYKQATVARYKGYSISIDDSYNTDLKVFNYLKSLGFDVDFYETLVDSEVNVACYKKDASQYGCSLVCSFSVEFIKNSLKKN